MLQAHPPGIVAAEMARDFVTLFDLNYLPRALVLYRSLVRSAGEFRLRVLCLDQETQIVLERLALPMVETIAVAELEAAHPELREVKPGRSPTEYAWTLTPASCLFALEREPALGEITYLDADLMFFSDPEPLFKELNGGSVLITRHDYAEEWEHLEALSGRYNVQFMVFRRDDRGLAALRWWHERCVEWCFRRHEDGKFGDQKYLDDWPERFEGIHVLEHPGGALAPWNVSRHEVTALGGSGGIGVDGQGLVFFHYQGLHLQWTARGRLAWWTLYVPSPTVARLLWQPYVRELERAVADAQEVAPDARLGVEPFVLRASLRRGARRVVPRRARRLLRSGLSALPSRHSWKSGSVARQHRDLILDQLARPEDVAPFRAFVEVIDELLNDPCLPDPARFLDFGCGAGHYSELLDRRFPARFDYTGCDVSEKMVETAQQLWPSRRFVVNDVFANQLDLSSFDVVCASALVDVLADYERALDTLLGSRAPYVILHRQRVTSGQPRAERTAGYKGQKTFASYIRLDSLEEIAARHSRRVAHTFLVEADMQSFILPLVSAP